MLMSFRTNRQMELDKHIDYPIFYYPSVPELLFWFIVRVIIRIRVVVFHISIQNVLKFRIVYMHLGNKCNLKALG